MADEPEKKDTDDTPKIRRSLSPFEEMDHIFEQMLGRDWPKSWMQPFQWNLPAWNPAEMPRSGRVPRVDIVERSEDILIMVEVPGVKKDQLDITVSDRTLTISGIMGREEIEEKGHVFLAERLRGRFSRTVKLPDEVDVDKAAARLEDGILTLTLPKNTRSHHRKIPLD